MAANIVPAIPTAAEVVDLLSQGTGQDGLVGIVVEIYRSIGAIGNHMIQHTASAAVSHDVLEAKIAPAEAKLDQTSALLGQHRSELDEASRLVIELRLKTANLEGQVAALLARGHRDKTMATDERELPSSGCWEKGVLTRRPLRSGRNGGRHS